MFEFKNWVAIGLFLFGSTFLWMTRDFLADRRMGTGIVWSIVQVLVFVALTGFAVAAWGVFKEAGWWEASALASAIVGVVALIAYGIGIVQIGDHGDAGVQINIAVHVLGLAAVLAVVLLPAVHTWIDKRI